MERDDDRSGCAQNDVKIKPVARITLARKPAPFFSQRIEINQKEHENAEHAELCANRSARIQQLVLRRKRPLLEGKRVVVEAVTADDKHNSQRSEPRETQTDAVAALQVLLCQHACANGCLDAHCPFPISICIVARNRRYAVKRCTLRQCCNGVSRSMVAETGIQYASSGSWN